MQEPIAYRNGKYLPYGQLSISPVDIGFIQGVTVAETLRTFGGRLYTVDRHLARFERSLRVIGLAGQIALDRLATAAEELVRHNHALLPAGHDLGLSVFVTPGIYASYGGQSDEGPTVAMHTYPLPFHLWVAAFERGQALVVAAARQVPADCWPSQLKCRSRMHYYLADRQAAALDPGARAVLLDHDGFVTEASTANLLVYRAGEGLVSPPIEKVLPGISLEVIASLAGELGLPMVYRELLPADLATADECFLSSTPFGLMPVTRLDRKPIGSGQPGQVFGRLVAAWSRHVGVDIVAQARQFAAGPV